MDITARAHFDDATPGEVYDMMMSPGYQKLVCQASHAEDYSVAIEGAVSKTSRKLKAPSMVAKFTGGTLNVVETIEWQPSAADGTRAGTITIEVPGQPVRLAGTISIDRVNGGSAMVMAGDLRINVPLIGKKMEQSAAPAMAAGFRTHEHVGGRWLASE